MPEPADADTVTGWGKGVMAPRVRRQMIAVGGTSATLTAGILVLGALGIALLEFPTAAQVFDAETPTTVVTVRTPSVPEPARRAQPRVAVARPHAAPVLRSADRAARRPAGRRTVRTHRARHAPRTPRPSRHTVVSAPVQPQIATASSTPVAVSPKPRGRRRHGPPLTPPGRGAPKVHPLPATPPTSLGRARGGDLARRGPARPIAPGRSHGRPSPGPPQGRGPASMR